MSRFINIFGSMIIMLIAVVMGVFSLPISMLFFGIGIMNAMMMIPIFILSSIIVFIIGFATFIYELTKHEVTVKHENSIPVHTASQSKKEKVIMVCSKCVTHNEHDSKFCKGCGNALTK